MKVYNKYRIDVNKLGFTIFVDGYGWIWVCLIKSKRMADK